MQEPLVPSGIEEVRSSWLHGAHGGVCRLLYAVHQTLSLLVPVQRWSIELPATTVGEWRRRRFLRRHKGGLWTVPLTTRFVASGLRGPNWGSRCGKKRHLALQCRVSLCDPAVPVRGVRRCSCSRVAIPSRDPGTRQQGAAEWCYHSIQAGTPRKGDQPKDWRATDPQISGLQPEDWAGRGFFF